MSKKDNNKYIVLGAALLYFICVFFFNQWIFDFSDVPTDDEYGLIFSVLGKSNYGSSFAYKLILRSFELFSEDFFQIFKLNFLTIHLIFPLVFFIYGYIKKYSFATNYFFTTLLVLSPLTPVITRKIHFWEVSFFTIALILSHFTNEKFRRSFLLFTFLLLMYLRVNFIFPLAVCFFLILYCDLKRSLWQSLLVAFALFSGGIVLILTYRIDMVELLRDANIVAVFKHDFQSYLTQIPQVLYNTFYTYNLYFIVLLFLIYSLKKFKFPSLISLEDELIATSLVMPILFIKYTQGYNVILFFVLLLLLSSFFRINPNKITTTMIYGISLILLCFYRPDLNVAPHYYPMFTSTGQTNLYFANFLKKIKPHKNKIFQVASAKDLELLVNRKDVRFTSYDELAFKDCDLLKMEPDYILLLKHEFSDFYLATKKCTPAIKYKTEKSLADYLILSKVTN